MYNVTADRIVFGHEIVIEGVTGLHIRSSVGTVFDGQESTRLFHVINADVTFTGVNLQNGFANEDSNSGANGGCMRIFSSNTVLTDMNITSCRAEVCP